MLALRGYQRYVSPMTPPTCRYYPSCSEYAVVAVQRHGLFRGTALATWRLLRCNPWSAGGVDDVPERGPRTDHHARVRGAGGSTSTVNCPEDGRMVETVPQGPTSAGRADVS
ncbi:MAG TPA: membrane protein insertion efficiency factor YidD [Cellulomonadaceae bacterium]|nr:membrane protein insertion efficiency factor YidD [Cellulomonadaceae bacterium]